MNKKYKIILIVIFLLMIFTLYIGRDYAKYLKITNSDDNKNAIVINEENLSINYSTGNLIDIKSLTSNYSLEKKFSITNMSNSTVYYIINLLDVDNSVDNTDSLTISLKSNNDSILEELEFPKDAMELTGILSIAPETTQSYILDIRYDGNSKPNDYLKAKIAVSLKESEFSTFKDIILVNNNLGSLKTVPGKDINQGNEGLVSSNDDDGITYYFRGDISNNYVKFADLDWRIVRINGDSSIRLILDNVLESDYAFNTNVLDSNRNDYYSLGNYSDATISLVLKEWYETNISNYSKNVVESKFCSDIMLGKEETDIAYSNNYIRINDNEEPSFNCNGNSYTANIGLLTIDEAVFAGAFKNKENHNYYLFNNSITKDWWLDSPSSVNNEHNVSIFTINSSNGIPNHSTINELKGVRPVINIRDTVKVTGSGLKDDPYIIQ